MYDWAAVSVLFNASHGLEDVVCDLSVNNAVPAI